MIEKLKKNKFSFEELVKRDFTKKYKRTILGMGWSILSPLLSLLIMWFVFGHFFASSIEHYVIYLFSGQIIYSYFTEATNNGMTSLLGNTAIFSKINVSKYLFLFSQNVSALINFGLNLLIFFAFVAIEGIAFRWNFFMLIYPIMCLIVFNLGVGLILSALYIFFRDMQYLWGIFTQLLMYMSAIFYQVDGYGKLIQNLFLLNPIYVYIRYFRKIVIENTIPTVQFHILAAVYAAIAFLIGAAIYKKNNLEFVYYA